MKRANNPRMAATRKLASHLNVDDKMKKKTKLMLIVPLTTVLLIVLVAPFLAGCSTTRQYSMPFAEAEVALFRALHLDKAQVMNNTIMAQAKAEGELEKSMSMKLFAISLHDHVPGKHLSFTASHIYNIGANGGEYIRFDLTAKQPELTEITVNYTDRWVGMWPPFVFLNPGTKREKNIHMIIWQENLATSDSSL